VNIELKPCPFCGSQYIDEKMLPTGGACMQCDACATEGPWCPTGKHHAEKWNDRHNCEPKLAATSDPVNHPSHYNSHPSGVECIAIARHMSFNLGNVVKYLWRAGLKGPDLEDLRKAKFYLEDEIKMREGVK
jgi:hypothetical protein